MRQGWRWPKTCNGCKMVKYCNASCQKAHRPMHKKECRKRAIELHDEAAFKQPPPRNECPICYQPLPLDNCDISYQVCCGKILCMGCIYADATKNNSDNCPFCRAPDAHISDGEYIERLKKRVEADDSTAIYNLGSFYSRGGMGLQQDKGKAMELWLRAGKLGCVEVYHNLGTCYYLNGEGVKRDIKKAKYYWELAAMGGDAFARYNLGHFEKNEGNMTRAVKHWIISAGSGDDESLKAIQKCFLGGHATKDDFEKALRAHKEAKGR